MGGDEKQMLHRNYHTHTKRCGHATGEDEDYIQFAIENGYEELGFSDHISHTNFQQNEEYIQKITALKEKYKNQIKILLGFECEYVESMLPYYQKLLQEKKVDYLLFGNHYAYIQNKRYDFASPFEEKEYLDYYYETLKKGLDTHLFFYVCHPDCFLKGYRKWDQNTIQLAHKIGKLLSQYDCYVELSGSGCRSRSYFEYQGQKNPPYPFKEFFKILKQYPLSFVLGADAHAPQQLKDFATEYIENMANELELNIITEPNLLQRSEEKNG